jgi:type I restriction enzyme, S subunit
MNSSAVQKMEQKSAERVNAEGAAVPKGYKRTELGVIPEDWVVKTIKQVAPLQRGFDLTNSQLREGNVPVAYSNGIMNFHNRAMVKGPGVYTGRSGTIGRVNYIEADYWPHNTSLWVTNFNGNHPKFISYMYSSIGFERFSSGSGVPTLNRNDAHEYKIPLPLLPEQQAIAEALSDVDGWVLSLDALIAKKRGLKTATMQQLLTGHTRLPGFTGEWETKKPSEMGYFISGNGFPIIYQGEKSGDYPFFKVSDMNNDGNATFMKAANHYVSKDIAKKLCANIVPTNSIVFAKIGAAIFLERKKILAQESCLDNNMMAFVTNDSAANHRYFHYLLLSIELGKLVSATALPSLSGREIGSLEFLVPKFEEQTAIATILSDMDAEITTLEAEREKASAIKQGMMQELLTGKTRLV